MIIVKAGIFTKGGEFYGKTQINARSTKYVQGKDALLQFHDEMTSLGDKWLFICSHSGYKRMP